ncbi:alpha--mannosylglycoprotein, partial [Lynx pardinus]
MGSGKESLIFMKKRTKRLTAQWALAAQRLAQKLGSVWRDQKQILVHIGFLTEESGDVFSPRVLKGGPLGEMVQWADILATLYVLGHGLRITVSLKELQSSLGGSWYTVDSDITNFLLLSTLVPGHVWDAPR